MGSNPASPATINGSNGRFNCQIETLFGNLATCIARQYLLIPCVAIDFQLQWSNWLIGKLHRPPISIDSITMRSANDSTKPRMFTPMISRNCLAVLYKISKAS